MTIVRCNKKAAGIALQANVLLCFTTHNSQKIINSVRNVSTNFILWVGVLGMGN